MAKPKKWLEGEAEAAIAMAGGRRSSAHAATALEAKKSENNGTGR